MQMFYAEAIVVSGWESIRYREMRKMRIHHVKYIYIASTSTATFSVSFHINSVKSYFDFIQKTFIFTNFSHTETHTFIKLFRFGSWCTFYECCTIAMVRLQSSYVFLYLFCITTYFISPAFTFSLRDYTFLCICSAAYVCWIGYICMRVNECVLLPPSQFKTQRTHIYTCSVATNFQNVRTSMDRMFLSLSSSVMRFTQTYARKLMSVVLRRSTL